MASAWRFLPKEDAKHFDAFKDEELILAGCDEHELISLLESDTFSDEQRKYVCQQLLERHEVTINVPWTRIRLLDPDSAND